MSDDAPFAELFSAWFADGTISAGQLATARDQFFPVTLDQFTRGLTDRGGIGAIRRSVARLRLRAKAEPPHGYQACTPSQSGDGRGTTPMPLRSRHAGRGWSDRLEQLAALNDALPALFVAHDRPPPIRYERACLALGMLMLRPDGGSELAMAIDRARRDARFDDADRAVAQVRRAGVLDLDRASRLAARRIAPARAIWADVTAAMEVQNRWIGEGRFASLAGPVEHARAVHHGMRLLIERGVLLRPVNRHQAQVIRAGSPFIGRPAVPWPDRATPIILRRV